MRFLLSLAVLILVSACGPSGPQGPVRVAIISDDTTIDDAGMRLSPASQHLRAATREGLVAIDETGQVIPALAERWIVTEDGLSYIFRLRNTDWPDGSPMSADDIQSGLQRALRQLRGTSLGLDLSKIDEIRAMTGRVIEVRLTSPMPDFLRLLAQPELGFANDDIGAGPMRRTNAAEELSVLLEAVPLEARGLPSREDWEAGAREIVLQALPAREAVDAFSSGEVDLVLNGQIADLPMADTGPLTRGTVRLDAALGTFGFIVRSERGVLSETNLREAVAMAIDRSDLMQRFNIGGWQATTWIVPLDLVGDSGPQDERWDNLSIAERREIARRRVESWNGVRERPLRFGSDCRQVRAAIYCFGNWNRTSRRSESMLCAPPMKAALIWSWWTAWRGIIRRAGSSISSIAVSKLVCARATQTIWSSSRFSKLICKPSSGFS